MWGHENLRLVYLKDFTDDKCNPHYHILIACKNLENIVVKEEITSYQYFLSFSHDVFRSFIPQKYYKTWLYGKNLLIFVLHM